jgi:flagellar biosynthesis component FlhA
LSIETTGQRSGHSLLKIFLERKMLMMFFKDAIKSPAKTLALCFIAYFATISFVVFGLLVLLAIHWVVKEMKKKGKAILAAEADAEAARVESEKLAARAAAEAKPEAQPAGTTTAAANDSNAKPAPTRQYAKSAVVLPFKTGTR